jgi:hypothetical protein
VPNWRREPLMLKAAFAGRISCCADSAGIGRATAGHHREGPCVCRDEI